jgi:hypothetical protein
MLCVSSASDGTNARQHCFKWRATHAVMVTTDKPRRIVVRCSRAKFDPHPRVWLLHDMTNDEYIIETRRRHSGRLYVRKFGSHEQAEKFFRNLTTGERL